MKAQRTKYGIKWMNKWYYIDIDRYRLFGPFIVKQ